MEQGEREKRGEHEIVQKEKEITDSINLLENLGKRKSFKKNME
jgi:hypothetical protein